MKKLALKINQKLYYGWVMMVLSGLAFFFSAPGQTYSISVFINAYNQEFGYSATQISSAYSIATVFSGLLLIFMGRAVDRYGARRMLIIVATLLALTAFYNSFVTNLAMIFFGFFLLRYFGQGSMTLIPNSLVPQWFEKKRAFSMSLAGFGNLLATMSIPAFNLWMITQYGWPTAWRIWSLILLIGFVPIAIIFVVNKPEDIGISIENSITGSDDDVKASLLKMESESFTLKQAIKTKEFWFVGFISTIPSMVSTGITFHFFSMMSLKGVSNQEAAIIIGLIALPAFAMPLIARVLIDNIKVKYVFFITLVMVILSLAFLIWGVTGYQTAIIFVLLYGTAIAIMSLALNVLWPNYFGRRYLGSIRGAATVFMVLGSALGPLPFGIGFDLTGGYTIVIGGMMVYTFIAVIMALSIQKPEKQDFETPDTFNV
ncbi:MAG: MFS transporter [Acholeplasmataceae bacterium]